MSNFLDNVEIKNFWGDKSTIKIKFYPDVSFLIGANGSGKTTVLNLIASALNADLYQLQNFIFDEIIIVLKSKKSRVKPKIIIRKCRIKEELTYFVYETSSSQAENFNFDKYDLNEFEERNINRRNTRRHFMHNHISTRLEEKLSQFYDVSWLTIHRLPRHMQDERSYESSVDLKLRNISNDLVRYFSLLKTNAQKEIIKFQESVFLSLITADDNKVWAHKTEVDMKLEKKLLIDIFKEFKISEQTYYKEVGDHFSKLSVVFKKLQNDEDLVSNEGIIVLENKRIQKVVSKWIKIKEEQEKIYKPQETFIKILNSLMQNKDFYISDNNELEVKLRNKSDYIGLRNLSSGEKQLLILLTETFLQKNKPWLYFADEPELSLHVDWQEKLIDYMKQLNPNAQLIVATHSPDIVGRNQDKIIRMEDIIDVY